MTLPTKSPFGPGSLTEAIRAAVDNLKPEDRLRRRDVLKLEERQIVGDAADAPQTDTKREAAPKASAEDAATTPEDDAFIFRQNVA